MPSTRSLVIILAAVAVAFLALTTAVARVGQYTAPTIALAMPVTNGFAKSERAEQLIIQAAPKDAGSAQELALSDAEAAQVSALSQAAYRAEPLDFAALRNIGLLKDRGGDRTAARALLRGAATLTKRDPITNLWLVRDYSELQDLPAVMAAFDQTLRTSTQAQSVLMPALQQGLSNDAMVPPLVEMLSKDPKWGVQFWNTVFTVPAARENAAQVRIALAKTGHQSTRRADQLLIESLIRTGKFATAEGLGNALVPSNATGGLVRNHSFDQPRGFVPFDWETFFDSFFSVDIDQQAGQMRVNTFANGSGLVARRLVRLTGSGQFRLTAKAAEWDALDPNALYFRIYCAEVGPAYQNQNRIPLTAANFAVNFSKARGDCTYHWFDIYARAQSGQQDNIVVLDDVSITASAAN